MLKQETRGLSLYNFFSVLLPGVTFNLALVPLLPSGTDIDPVFILLPFLAGGFVTGQALHSVSVTAQYLGRNLTHREVFRDVVRENTNPESLPPQIVETFYYYSIVAFPELDLQQGSDDLERTLRSLYILVRSQIHSHGVGRSRVMQAIYAFCRSIWISSILLVVIYFVYCLLHLEITVSQSVPFQRHWPERFAESTYPYTTFLETTDVPIGTVLLSLLSVLGISYITFAYATSQYKKHYIQYLIADFVAQQELEYEDVVREVDLPSEEDDDGDSTG